MVFDDVLAYTAYETKWKQVLQQPRPGDLPVDSVPD
jgi:hypothetical protein